MISLQFFILYPQDRKGNFAVLRDAVGADKRLTTGKEVSDMFLEIEWYWWLIIIIVLVFSIPFKMKAVKWWNTHQQEKKDSKSGKWGDDE